MGFLLHALAGCVTTTLVLHAAARGIRIESISKQMEGQIDLQIRMKMDIKADCSDEALDDLLAFTRRARPRRRAQVDTVRWVPRDFPPGR